MAWLPGHLLRLFPLALSLRLHGRKAGLSPHPHGKSHDALPLDGVLSHRRTHGGPAHHGSARQGAELRPQPVLLGSAQLGSRCARHNRPGREPAPPQQAGRKAAGEHRNVRRDDPSFDHDGLSHGQMDRHCHVCHRSALRGGSERQHVLHRRHGASGSAGRRLPRARLRVRLRRC